MGHKSWMVFVRRFEWRVGHTSLVFDPSLMGGGNVRRTAASAVKKVSKNCGGSCDLIGQHGIEEHPDVGSSQTSVVVSNGPRRLFSFLAGDRPAFSTVIAMNRSFRLMLCSLPAVWLLTLAVGCGGHSGGTVDVPPPAENPYQVTPEQIEAQNAAAAERASAGG